jgi:hypothetical protein
MYLASSLFLFAASATGQWLVFVGAAVPIAVGGTLQLARLRAK